jgi:type VI secretion system secreted protein VgrG
MDDTAGKEKITIHGQYDMGTTVEHDQTDTVHNNRVITIDGTHTETIKKDTKITITEGPYTHKVAANTATHIANKEIVTTSETAHIHDTAATEIKLEVGASKLLMKADGSISLEGVNITINGKTIVTVLGGIVHSEAKSEHQTKGAIVLSEGSGTNTIKGGMVMLNP